ncbi:hypothetical protein [Paracoccus litorisediminis]|uniref:Uncharacterized protein n=1 Tax=Paracoccus litorisediminis TaxID=2006130 RepID=A0A844HME8_9RHOB|nr:hypothetical protein [Paracoccus litorisediminis]MTH61100.1 hypothetical protein [Paracoccus litorisediminis]
MFDLPNGKEVYLAFRKLSEMFRGGEKSISDAIVQSKASWAIDYDTLIRLRTEGVYYVGVLVKETEDVYITTLGEFLTAPTLNYSARGGALQRYLPLDKFLISLGSVRGIKAKKPRKAP